MKRLYRSTVRNQLAREPIEQIRMRWQRSVMAKIIRRIDEALAEVIVPDVIRARAPSEGGRPTCDPLRERSARRAFVAVRSFELALQIRNRGQRVWVHGLDRIINIAAPEQSDGARLVRKGGVNLVRLRKFGESLLRV